MIRHRQGTDFLLITQDDHARLSGRFAEHVGNAAFATPLPLEPVITGVSLHDRGWPLHDANPTLNPKGEPLHVLESPMPIATQVWGESARLAAEAHPYSGLLVSLHVLNLSALAQKRDATPHERYQNRNDLFLLNRFQQQEIERQDGLRRRMGMPTDLQLTLGLAKPGMSEAEDLLRFNFGLLRLMDALSLDACCAEPLFPKVEGVHPRPGAEAVSVQLDHPGEGDLGVVPWPFDPDRLEFAVPCRRVPGSRYESEEAFRQAYAAATVEEYTVKLRPA